MPEEPHHFSRSAEKLIADLRGVPDADPKRQKLRPTRELSALIDAGNQHGFEEGAGGVNRRRVAGGAGANDDNAGVLGGGHDSLERRGLGEPAI